MAAADGGGSRRDTQTTLLGCGSNVHVYVDGMCSVVSDVEKRLCQRHNISIASCCTPELNIGHQATKLQLVSQMQSHTRTGCATREQAPRVYSGRPIILEGALLSQYYLRLKCKKTR